MRIADFLKRRFIRLHPMVIIGALIGAVMFYFQGCSVWDVSQVPVVALIIATLMNVLLIPATPGMEIRGVGEMYPPERTELVFVFEYIGNILYAFFLHKLSTKVLSILVLSAGCGLAIFALWGPLGDICGLCFDGRKYNRWFFTVAVLISGGIIVITYIQACQGARGFLDREFIVVLSAVPRIWWQ